jgi:hypothetical protein
VNREQWLTQLAGMLDAALFTPAGHPLPPNLRISVGFPSRGGLSRSKPHVGECFYQDESAAGVFEIFISPVLGDGMIAAATLVHELCHALLPEGTGHKRPFAKLAHKMGLEGKATATIASAELIAKLEPLIAELGDYPHAELHPVVKQKKQTTRMLKTMCEHCGYVARVSKAWLAKGAPVCPTHGLPMIAEEPEEGEETAA